MIMKKIIIFFCLNIFFVSSLYAEDAMIDNFIVNKRENSLLLTFVVKNSFSKDIEKLVGSGTPVSFSFDIDVEKVRSYLPDSTVYETEITHKLRYSSLTKVYYVTKPYISDEPYIISSRKKAVEEMSAVTDFEIKGLKFEPGESYEVRVRARLREVTLPFYLHKVLFFMSFFDFKSEWKSLDIEF